MWRLSISTVKSRNLLSIPEHGGLDEPHHPVGLGGEYPEWDRQADVMAAWRLEQQHKQEQAELREAEPRPLILNTNETRAQKAILIDLHSHRYWPSSCSCFPFDALQYMEAEGFCWFCLRRSNETAKVIQLERTVNETSWDLFFLSPAAAGAIGFVFIVLFYFRCPFFKINTKTQKRIFIQFQQYIEFWYSCTLFSFLYASKDWWKQCKSSVYSLKMADIQSICLNL